MRPPILLLVLVVCTLCSVTVSVSISEVTSPVSTSIPSIQSVISNTAPSSRQLLQSGPQPAAAAGDSTTRNVSVSWAQQLKDSITGVLVGLALFVFSFPLLVWNELKAARIYRVLAAARKAVRSNVDCDRVDASLNGKLLHLVGPVDTPHLLRDDQLGLDFANCVKYRRTAEMYQWVQRKHEEEEDKLGGGKEIKITYTYNRQWSSIVHDSSNFFNPSGHENPTWWPIQSRSGEVAVIGFGNGRPQPRVLSPLQISQIDWYQHRAITELDLQRMNDDWKTRFNLHPGGVLYLPHSKATAVPRESDDSSVIVPIHVGDARVGDLKISYEEIPCGIVSVMGRQSGSTFVPWVPPPSCNCCGSNHDHTEDEESPLIGRKYQSNHEHAAGCCDQLRGREDIIYCDNGARSANSMLGNRATANSNWSWVMRAIGYLMMWVGMTLILNPVVTFVKVWPFLSKVIGGGITLATGIVALPLTLVTISLAWIFARPLIVVILLGMAAGIICAVSYA